MESGKVCMIDLEAIFNYAQRLPVPEIVDFRFTKNIRDALGALG
jgi:phosphatidylinositol kinase/protein kinase (PI-3  family)